MFLHCCSLFLRTVSGVKGFTLTDGAWIRLAAAEANRRLLWRWLILTLEQVCDFDSKLYKRNKTENTQLSSTFIQLSHTGAHKGQSLLDYSPPWVYLESHTASASSRKLQVWGCSPAMGNTKRCFCCGGVALWVFYKPCSDCNTWDHEPEKWCHLKCCRCCFSLHRHWRNPAAGWCPQTMLPCLGPEFWERFPL